MAAALALAVLPWGYGADRQPSTAVLLWLLPRLSTDRVRAHYAPYANPRLRGPLLALARAAYRDDPDGAAWDWAPVHLIAVHRRATAAQPAGAHRRGMSGRLRLGA